MTYENVTGAIALLPKLDGSGYTQEVWYVGEKKFNPDKEEDIVEKIVFFTRPQFRALITYRDYGEEQILDHLTFILFKKDARDRSVSTDQSGD